MKVILESDRDRRVFEWLVEQVGESAVIAAAESLAGARKPYVSNIAKALGLTPPDHLMLTPRETAKQKLSAIKGMLSRK